MGLFQINQYFYIHFPVQKQSQVFVSPHTTTFNTSGEHTYTCRKQLTALNFGTTKLEFRQNNEKRLHKRITAPKPCDQDSLHI